MEKTKLTPELSGELLNAQRDLNDVQSELDAAEECGIDCTYHRGASAEANHRISKLLKNFGPGIQP